MDEDKVKREDYIAALKNMVRTIYLCLKEGFIVLSAFGLLFAAGWLIMTFPFTTITIGVLLCLFAWFAFETDQAHVNRILDERDKEWRENFCKPAHKDEK